MAKERERKIAEGIPPANLPPPYFHLSAPITATRLLSSDHHHRIAMRCRFIIVPGRRRQRMLELQAAMEGAKKKEQQPVTSTSSTAAASANGPHSTQLGRPTKSNINAQRVIADLSVATALGEEQEGENEVPVFLIDFFTSLVRSNLCSFMVHIVNLRRW